MEQVVSQKILIVDDDYDIRLGLDVRLRASGYETASAEDGESALQAAAAEAPDLILLDLGLPGADGFEVLAELGASPALARIPVIVLTAAERTENERRALEAGAVAFQQKPISGRELLGVIESVIR